jgi:ADP-heptose:LPS heptosyltransferase
MKRTKILVVRLSSIGDIVLTTPVLRLLTKQIKNVEVHYATRATYASLLEANPHVAKLHLLDNSFVRFIREIRAERFDYVIDLHNNFKTFWLKGMAGCKTYSFSKLNLQKWLLVNAKINLMPNKHIVDRYVDTLKPLGIAMDDEGLEYYVPHKDVVEEDWLPKTHRKDLVVFAIGGQYGTKRLPRERIIEVCDKINKPVILLGGKEDAEEAAHIARFFEKRNKNKPFEKGLKDLNKKTVVFNGCGKFNLNQSASIIKKSIAVFTHDTGLMHIAAAFGKEVFSIWGNTVPEFGMYPYRTKFTVFENNALPCRPCSKIGHAGCPLGHFQCMKKQVIDFYIP